MSLKRQALSAIRWTAMSMIGRSVLQFLQIVVLARFLIPEDFGLIVLVVAVIAFAQTFSDMGIGNAIIHHQIIGHEVLSSLYWLNVLIGALLMALFAFSAAAVADLYQSPVLQPLLTMASIYFLITALGQQLIVMAEKNLHFPPLARIELFSAFCGFIAVVIAAWAGGGAYSIVVGMLTGATVTTALAWLILARGWRPLLRIKLDEIRPFLGFGTYMVGQNILSTLNTQADMLIGGRVLPANAFGMYSLPREISLRVAWLINPIVTRVGFPVMAKAREDLEYLRATYLKILRMTASVNFPVYAAIALFAPELVLILFGNKWEASVPLLRVLAIWGMFRSVGNPAGSLVFAVGRADLAFKWNLAQILIIPPVLWFGAKFGAMGMALASLFAMIGYMLPGWYFLIRPLCGARFGEYFQQLLVPFLLTLVSSVLAYGATWPIVDTVSRMAVGISLGGLSYLALSRKFNRQWFDAMSELFYWRSMDA